MNTGLLVVERMAAAKVGEHPRPDRFAFGLGYLQAFIKEDVSIAFLQAVSRGIDSALKEK